VPRDPPGPPFLRGEVRACFALRAVEGATPSRSGVTWRRGVRGGNLCDNHCVFAPLREIFSVEDAIGVRLAAGSV
jgi:hypothetical protein